ncbi:MAG: alpha/beta hydrolase [Sulfurimonas sp.]|nr:alpha/beta hydrolase [Sulfurimonas sp.]
MKKLLPLSFLLLLGCATPDSQESLRDVSAYLQKSIIKKEKFDILAFESDLAQCNGERLFVFVEGDGAAWKSRNVVSNDPTPKKPTSLFLLNSVQKKCSLYLARPCQYTGQKCDKKEFTSHRYSPAVLKNYNEILTTYKQKYAIDDFVLVGYSGGGAVVALLATMREDISAIVTVASNLDTDAWTSYHNVTPLYGSLNPAHFAYKLEDIPQYHLVGSRDTIVPQTVFESYKSRFSNQKNIHLFVYDNGHYDGWDCFFREFFQSLY